MFNRPVWEMSRVSRNPRRWLVHSQNLVACGVLQRRHEWTNPKYCGQAQNQIWSRASSHSYLAWLGCRRASMSYHNKEISWLLNDSELSTYDVLFYVEKERWLICQSFAKTLESMWLAPNHARLRVPERRNNEPPKKHFGNNFHSSNSGV